MRKWKSSVGIILSFWILVAGSSLSWGHIPKESNLPETVRKFLEWEFHANVVNDPQERKPQAFAMEHFEIPMSAILEDRDPETSPKILESLMFEKNGEKYIRWIINPEDVTYHKDLEKILKLRNIPYERKKYFNGFLTASRSLIIQDPQTGTIFSAKVSTDNTGGWWKAKAFSSKEVEKGRLGTKFVKKSQGIVNYGAMKPLFEPIGFSLKGGSGKLNQGFLIRELDAGLTKNQNYYLPGFAALHPEVGKSLAERNGSDNPAEYWHKNFALPLARAQAEFAAYHGFSYGSAHMQQFAVELDRDFKPTGKILFRDFQDANALRPFYDKEIPFTRDLLDLWFVDYKQNDLIVRFGMFKARIAPPWISKEEQRKWMQDYFREFEKTYAKITGIPESVLTEKTKISGSLRTYVTKKYVLQKNKTDLFAKGTLSPVWQRYFDIARCFQGEKLSRTGKPCAEVLEEIAQRLAADSNCKPRAK